VPFSPWVDRCRSSQKCCLIDLLLFMYELLGMAKENTLRPKVKAVLDELAKLATPHLTTVVPA
jgi:hypothetical protein